MTLHTTRFIDLGQIDYGDAYKLQQQLFNELLGRKAKSESGENVCLCCEHTPVITIGKHGKDTNLLFNRDQLAERGVALYTVDRGGDVTYHGPGQLVLYPIWDLSTLGLGLRNYIHLLEEAVIRTIDEYGIKGERVNGASGVWIGVGSPFERKICALGVKSSKFITMHGLALNVNTDLSGFALINPCGFTDKGVTSIKVETGIEYPLACIQETLAKHLLELLNCHIFS